jgi:hypothetical protein
VNTPIVFLDCETDGVHPGRQPWEVAMILREPDKPDDAVSFYVQIDLSTADPFGLKVGGFYARHPLGRWLTGSVNYEAYPEPVDEDVHYVSRAEAARWVARVMHGAHVVGAVPNFDTECLDRLLRTFGLLPAWHYHLIDIEAMTVGYLHAKGDQFVRADGLTGGPALPWESDALSRACGVDPPSEAERHTALGDARWAQRLYDAIVGVPDRARSAIG